MKGRLPVPGAEFLPEPAYAPLPVIGPIGVDGAFVPFVPLLSFVFVSFVSFLAAESNGGPNLSLGAEFAYPGGAYVVSTSLDLLPDPTCAVFFGEPPIIPSLLKL